MNNILKIIVFFAIMINSFAFGQTKTISTATKVDCRYAMIDIVNQAKPAYTKGMTYEAFVQAVGANPKTLTNQANTFLKEIYGYVSKDSTDLEIFSATNCKTLKDIVDSNALDNQIVDETGKSPCNNIICIIIRVIKGGSIFEWP